MHIGFLDVKPCYNAWLKHLEKIEKKTSFSHLLSGKKSLRENKIVMKIVNNRSFLWLKWMLRTHSGKRLGWSFLLLPEKKRQQHFKKFQHITSYSSWISQSASVRLSISHRTLLLITSSIIWQLILTVVLYVFSGILHSLLWLHIAFKVQDKLNQKFELFWTIELFCI